MKLLHDCLLYAHIVTGALALLLFWMPVALPKGGNLHRKSGVAFAWTMYVVAGSGFLMAGIDLAWPRLTHGTVAADDTQLLRDNALFLLSLSVLVLATTRHGWLSIRARGQREILRRWPHLVLCLLMGGLGIWLFVQGAMRNQWLWIAFGLLQLWLTLSFVHYACKSILQPREWWTEHLAAFIGSGIGAYTAFFVFGGGSLLGAVSESVTLTLWLAPAVLGGLAIALLTRHYRLKFDSTSSVAAGGGSQ